MFMNEMGRRKIVEKIQTDFHTIAIAGEVVIDGNVGVRSLGDAVLDCLPDDLVRPPAKARDELFLQCVRCNEFVAQDKWKAHSKDCDVIS